ncbi:MAG TPA: peptide ABC transporter substrate-binding protein [Candidatus Bathyarchaeia archaeon]|nr:peptide ABC transporter substrate-binding protein [Candidatus Bathyarchaeia archaeon]
MYWQAPTILNVHQATGTKDADAARLIQEPLASWGVDGKPSPNLVKEIPTVANGGVSSDFTTITWHLLDGLKWSDGTAVTADDVVFTSKYMADEATADVNSNYMDGVKSVVATNPTTITVTYSAATANPYQFGTGGGNEIMQKAQFEKCMGAKASECPENLKPIGTGPYKLTEFKSGDVVTYEINTNYRDPKKPFFKTVQMKGGGDALSAARAVFQTGDVDYAWNLQVEAPVLKSLIQGSTKGDYLGKASSNVERVNINFANPDPALGDSRSEPTTKHPFFNGPDGLIVRQALAMATDRATIGDQLYGGLTGTPTCNQLLGNPDWESKNTASMSVCKFDAAAANKLLDDNGWVKGSDGVRAKNGVKLNILFATTVNALRQKEQDILKANWQAVGFKVELRSITSGVFFTNAADGADRFYYDVSMFTNGTTPDITGYMAGWTTKQIAQKSNNWNLPNIDRYSNPAYDAIVDQMRITTDQAKLNQLGIQANDILIKDVVVIPLVNRFQVASGKSKSLQGTNLNPWDSEMWNIADWYKTP